jgi:hypothetical protein
MIDHIKRFRRWQQRLPDKTGYLVTQVIDRLLPFFSAEGFVWYPDYAKGDVNEVGNNVIPLQNREGTDWPTAEIRFGKRQHACFSVDFGVLPPLCRRWDEKEISQDEAVVVYAPIWFTLLKGTRKNFDANFGLTGFSFRPYKTMDAEIDKAVSLLPIIFDLFKTGVPEAWMTRDFGRVSEHILLAGSWHIRAQRRQKIATKDRSF